MKRILIVICALCLFLPSVVSGQNSDNGEPKYKFDDPGAVIEPNPIIDLNVISDAGFASFRADEAKTLDLYTNHDIEFDIIIDADTNEMTNAFLILSVYDVDLNAEIPEVDKVYLNDRYIGDLTGDNNAWSFTTFPLQTEWLKGQTKEAPGVNHIKISVDSMRSTTFWVLCDWGVIKANIGFQVVSIIPSGVSIGSNQYEVNVKFNEDIDEGTLKDNLLLTYKDFNEIKTISGKVIYDSEKKIARFLPSTPLSYGIEYTVRITKNIKNLKGENLKSERKSSFVTLPTLKEK